MLASQDYLKEIISYLSWLSTAVEEQNKLDLTDMNHGAEDFFCGLLNMVYGYELTNINIVERNAAAIDLGDKSAKVAIQVTSTSSLKKTTTTVEKFIEKRLFDEYDKLIILNIVKKSVHQTRFIGDTSYQLDTQTDVRDKSDLITDINGLGTDQKKKVLDYLKSELRLPPSPTVSKEISTIMRLIEAISDDDHPAAGIGFCEEPFPDEKINERFADHAELLRNLYNDRYQEYGGVLEAVRDEADFGAVRLRRAGSYLKSHSDAVLTACGGDPMEALRRIIDEFRSLLEDAAYEFDAGAAEFYIVDQLIKCNVFPRKEETNAQLAFEG